MDIIQAIILGIVQGAGEFLPISSTAHLVALPYIFNWKDPGLGFDVALHLGTLIALIVFFFWDWAAIIYLEFFKIIKFSPKAEQPITDKIQKFRELYQPNLIALIIIATVPGVIAGILLETKAETVFRNPLLIALALSLAGLILFLIDKYSKRKKDLNKITILDAVIIGISQAVAIIPGVSRSGATITAGRARGLDRVSAARFSFLLSVPIILGAAAVKLPKLFSDGIDASVAVGIFFSALSGYFAIKYLLKFLEKSSCAVFFWYRLALALIIGFLYIYR
ncbi:MAG: undecaprenyl-diphosphate phosphatase [bacterium]|nr:undecaprenyl-diphosphate phosphatase [bacterium]